MDNNELINPEEIQQDSLSKSIKRVKRSKDIVERSDDTIITDDGKELLI